MRPSCSRNVQRRRGRPSRVLSSLGPVKVARPRLLVGSLAVALVVGVGLGVVVAKRDDGRGRVDANLVNPLDRQPSPGDQLGNADVTGARFPVDAILTDRDGTAFAAADLIGRPLVVNFWFSTCPPCAKELPDFAEVDREFGDEVRFVGVNTLDSVPVMERFAGERGVEYELYRDEFAELTNAIGATAFPVTIFVTSDGTIVDQTGALDAGELRAKVAQLQALEGAA